MFRTNIYTFFSPLLEVQVVPSLQSRPLRRTLASFTVATIYIYCTYFHRWVGVLLRPLNLLFHMSLCVLGFSWFVVFFFFIRISAHFVHSSPIPPTASKLSKTWKTNFVHFFFLHLMAVLKTDYRTQKCQTRLQSVQL